MAEYDAKGNLRFRVDLRQSLKIWQHVSICGKTSPWTVAKSWQPWVLAHRIQLHEALKEHAGDPNAEGPPVVLKKLQKVTQVDAETATITLQDGTTVTGDLILGADGVGVRCPRFSSPVLDC
jgi:2-polyprenyl-6-methoxyphenol hydroxylase-like FAD-dependent oxidoreductase